VTRRLLIVWHSVTGGSRQMAQAAAEAAQAEAAVQLRVLQADAAGPGDLIDSSGYLFACPENLGSMSGPMKSFFDRSYYPALDRIQGRPYASLICTGSDGSGTARQIERIATGWRLRAVAPPLIVCTQAQTPERIVAPKTIEADDLERCRELGAALASGLSLGIY
jgi:multimeric flavodoxin WrbA